jgi:hypothetical protein
MAEKMKSLLEGGPLNALGEGAARFDRLIESVKAQQLPMPAPEPVAAPAPNPLLHASPGEEWARRFQSQAIGPEQWGVSLSDLVAVPKAMLVPPIPMPDFVPERTAERAADLPPRPAAPVLEAPLGTKMGKPEKPRRSFLGRLFHRD